MNFLKVGVIPISIALVACETMNQPISTGSFDPLSPPGETVKVSPRKEVPKLTPGQFATANIPNTAFYNQKPSKNQNADKLLDVGTQMKIVSIDSNMVKVELDSGAVGYVPAVMVSGADPTDDQDLLPIDGTYQMYPQLPSGGPMEPLPIIDLEGLPPEDAIPTIINPDEPAVVPEAPTLDPIPSPITDSIPTPSELEKEELDPVARAVREKVEAAMKEDALKNTAIESGEKVVKEKVLKKPATE